MSFLYQPLFGDYQVIHAVYVLAALVAVIGVWNFIARRMTLANTNAHLVQKTCRSCGWSGRTGPHVKKCPKCNANL
jgi:hypothetical protein